MFKNKGDVVNTVTDCKNAIEKMRQERKKIPLTSEERKSIKNQAKSCHRFLSKMTAEIKDHSNYIY